MLFILLSSTFPWLPLLSLPPSVAFPLALLSSQLLLLCCKIQLPNWFNFLPFRTLLTYFPSTLSLSTSLYLSRSLACPLSLAPVSHPDLAEPQIIEWFEFLYWICCLTRSSFLVPLLPPQPSFPRLHFRTVPTRLFIFFPPLFHLLPFFAAIFACCFFCVDIFFY